MSFMEQEQTFVEYAKMKSKVIQLAVLKLREMVLTRKRDKLLAIDSSYDVSDIQCCLDFIKEERVTVSLGNMNL